MAFAETAMSEMIKCRDLFFQTFLFVFTRSAHYVHATEEIYTVTQLDLAKLTKEPSAYVPDPLVVTKRHKGEHATSW